MTELFVNHENAAVRVYAALNIAGASAFALIIIASWLSRAIERSLTWFSFCASWIIFGGSYAFLTLAGHQFGEIPFGPCVTQAAAIYATPVLLSGTCLALIIHLHNAILILTTTAKSPQPLPGWARVMLVVSPWALWSITFLTLLGVGLRHPDRVRMLPDGTICHLTFTEISKVIATWTIFCLVLFLYLLGSIIWSIRQSRSVVNSVHAGQTLIRLILFTTLGLVCSITYIPFAVKQQEVIFSDLFLSMLSLPAAIIFGAQKNLFRNWTLPGRNTNPNNSHNFATVTSDISGLDVDNETPKYHPYSTTPSLRT